MSLKKTKLFEELKAAINREIGITIALVGSSAREILALRLINGFYEEIRGGASQIENWNETLKHSFIKPSRLVELLKMKKAGPIVYMPNRFFTSVGNDMAFYLSLQQIWETFRAHRVNVAIASTREWSHLPAFIRKNTHHKVEVRTIYVENKEPLVFGLYDYFRLIMDPKTLDFTKAEMVERELFDLQLPRPVLKAWKNKSKDLEKYLTEALRKTKLLREIEEET